MVTERYSEYLSIEPDHDPAAAAHDASARVVARDARSTTVQIVTAWPRIPEALPPATKRELIEAIARKVPAWWAAENIFLDGEDQARAPARLGPNGVRFVALLKQLRPDGALLEHARKTRAAPFLVSYEVELLGDLGGASSIVLRDPGSPEYYAAPIARPARTSGGEGTIDYLALLPKSPDEERLRGAVDRIVREIRDYPLRWSPDNARSIVDHFQKLNRASMVVDLAKALIGSGVHDPEIRRSFGLALINTGRIGEAIAVLAALANEREGSDPKMYQDVVGIIGRAYKQLYLDARPSAAEPRSHDLRLALEYYHRGYEVDPEHHYWHAINLAALLCHRDRVVRPEAPVPPSAQKLLEGVARVIAPADREDDPWKLATAVELEIARGDPVSAFRYAKAFTERGATAFVIGSVRRQLETVWGLTRDTEPGEMLLALLDAAYAKMGELIHVSSGAAFRKKLEAKFGSEYQAINWLKCALERGMCVAVLGRDRFSKEATGFYLSGDQLGYPKEERKALLITNAHAVSPDEDVQDRDRAMDPRSCCATFTAHDGAPSFEIKGCLATSSPDDHDITILELPPEAAELLDKTSPPIGRKAVKKDEAINIIGHPLGGDLSFSIRNNKVVEISGAFLRYLAPTEPGSSGSPIFDDSWNLVGIHHGSLTRANEGIIFSKIREVLDEARPRRPGGNDS